MAQQQEQQWHSGGTEGEGRREEGENGANDDSGTDGAKKQPMRQKDFVAIASPEEDEEEEKRAEDGKRMRRQTLPADNVRVSDGMEIIEANGAIFYWKKKEKK